MGDRQVIEFDPRTRPSFRTVARFFFHYNGARDFMDGMNADLRLDGIQASINRGLGDIGDVVKYAACAAVVGRLAYEAVKHFS